MRAIATQLVEAFLKLLELAPRLLLALAIVGTVILLMPEPWADVTGMTEFRSSYRSWIGLTTLVAAALWVSHYMARLVAWVSRRRAIRRRRAAVIQSIATLSREECLLLGYFIGCGAPTQSIPLHYAPAQALASKGLLKAIPGQGHILNWPHTIPDFVWAHLIANRETYLPGASQAELDQFVKSHRQHMHNYSV